jgi:hypothetical protein
VGQARAASAGPPPSKAKGKRQLEKGRMKPSIFSFFLFTFSFLTKVDRGSLRVLVPYYALPRPDKKTKGEPHVSLSSGSPAERQTVRSPDRGVVFLADVP